VDKYLGRTFNYNSYHCWHHVQAIFREVLNIVLPDFAYVNTKFASKRLKAAPGFKEIKEPIEGCIVRGENDKHKIRRYHVGVFFDNIVHHCEYPRSRAESLIIFNKRYSRLRYFIYDN
jgi:uncharacterized Fe-S radical SAM superfamily protein PflX